MTPVHDLLLVYASTSGRTRALFRALAAQAGPRAALLELGPEPPVLPAEPVNTVIFGSPTYGRGDLHHRWTEHLPAVLKGLRHVRTAGVIGIGDSRYHARTYCGSLKPFSAAVKQDMAQEVACQTLYLDVRAFPLWPQQTQRWMASFLHDDLCGGPSQSRQEKGAADEEP
jgi:flavodoxin